MKDPKNPPRSDQVRTTPRVAPTRCPYCHDDVRPEGSVACQDCLGRHHAACWNESGACASCGSAQQMRAAPRLLDEATVRRILLSNDFTNEEIDAFFKGEKLVSCRVQGCSNVGTHDDLWRVKKRVCRTHHFGQWQGFGAGVLFLLLLFLILLAGFSGG